MLVKVATEITTRSKQAHQFKYIGKLALSDHDGIIVLRRYEFTAMCSDIVNLQP